METSSPELTKKRARSGDTAKNPLTVNLPSPRGGSAPFFSSPKKQSLRSRVLFQSPAARPGRAMLFEQTMLFDDDDENNKDMDTNNHHHVDTPFHGLQGTSNNRKVVPQQSPHNRNLFMDEDDDDEQREVDSPRQTFHIKRVTEQQQYEGFNPTVVNSPFVNETIGMRKLKIRTDNELNRNDYYNRTNRKISPTEVSGFPTVPATPSKQLMQLYNNNNTMNVPPTPALQQEQQYYNNASTSSFVLNTVDENSDTTLPFVVGGVSLSRFQSDFSVVGSLGGGSFGTVLKCKSKIDGHIYAVKCSRREMKGRADRHRLLKEVHALAALCNEADSRTLHIVRYHSAWIENNRLYIQTELCEMDVLCEMSFIGPLNEERRFKLLREVLLALELVHKHKLVHLDIKPENIFIKNDQFKLGDFGLVNKLNARGEVEEGDSRYMSRELLSENYTDLTKSDIFSLGATIYELSICKTLPADGEEWQNIRNGILSPTVNTSIELQEVIAAMMQPDLTKRPSASELLKHRHLMSEEQRQLFDEKKKVAEAQIELFNQKERMKNYNLQHPAPNKRILKRFNTWNTGDRA